MRVSEYVGQWVDAALFRHLTLDEECWFDVTMAPTGGGANQDAPFIACVLTMKSPIVNQTFNLVQVFPDFISLDEAEINKWVQKALTELRDAYQKALGEQSIVAPKSSGPGRLFLPGAGK